MPSVEQPWQEDDPASQRWQIYTSIKDLFTDHDGLVRTLWCEGYGAILLGGTVTSDEGIMCAGIVNFAPAHRMRETYYAVYSWLEGCDNNLEDGVLDAFFRSDQFGAPEEWWRHEATVDWVVATASFSAAATELFAQIYQNHYQKQASVVDSLHTATLLAEYPDLWKYGAYGAQLLRFAAGDILPLPPGKYDVA